MFSENTMKYAIAQEQQEKSQSLLFRSMFSESKTSQLPYAQVRRLNPFYSGQCFPRIINFSLRSWLYCKVSIPSIQVNVFRVRKVPESLRREFKVSIPSIQVNVFRVLLSICQDSFIATVSQSLLFRSMFSEARLYYCLGKTDRVSIPSIQVNVFREMKRHRKRRLLLSSLNPFYSGQCFPRAPLNFKINSNIWNDIFCNLLP